MKHWRLIYLTIPLTVAVFAAILLANEWKNARPAQGVGRVPEAVRYAAETEAVEEESADYRLDSYTEGEGPAPEWWMPGEPMAAEWTAETERRDIGCPDYDCETVIYGWNGHKAEQWELELLARCFYLEFWGTSIPCCEAGCDAMLNLWDTGLYGSTLGASLSYYDEDYGWTYSVYPNVWTTEYDPDGLEWCREFTMGRFLNGVEWDAVYFKLYGYHDPSWTVPLYEMDGVYFSGKGWQ